MENYRAFSTWTTLKGLLFMYIFQQFFSWDHATLRSLLRSFRAIGKLLNDDERYRSDLKVIRSAQMGLKRRSRKETINVLKRLFDIAQVSALESLGYERGLDNVPQSNFNSAF